MTNSEAVGLVPCTETRSNANLLVNWGWLVLIPWGRFGRNY